MAISKIQARKVRQPVLTGDYSLSGVLDGTTTQEVISLSLPAEKITVQSDGTLAGTVEFSVNGVDFFGSTAFSATVPLTYSSNLARVIRVTRSSGTGKLHILAR